MISPNERRSRSDSENEDVFQLLDDIVSLECISSQSLSRPDESEKTHAREIGYDILLFFLSLSRSSLIG